MVKLESAKCPNCGANLKLSKEDETVKCEYCQQTIIVDQAIACYKLKISGTVSIEGIETNKELVFAANQLLDMNEYLKAKRKFLELSEKCPDNYQGWLGLLICRTRNFTIRDNNIMFENDVNKYYEHFLSVAPDEIKKQYSELIENYLYPKSEQIIRAPYNKFNFKLASKYKLFIAPGLFLICGFSLFINSIFVGGLMWIIAGLILLPQLRNKIKISKKRSIIVASILGIVGFIAFAIESPYSFEGKWIAVDNSYYVEFNDDNVVITLSGGTKIEGIYSQNYGDNQYTILISTNEKSFNNKIFKYYSNGSNLRKMCLYENDSCTVYFKEITTE